MLFLRPGGQRRADYYLFYVASAGVPLLPCGDDLYKWLYMPFVISRMLF
ncbi:hypothetical protein ECDEC1A_2409 [Escherichia coli DEC1A]|nr:hypothetical protein ECDEC1A_2409 [Escherichia coli DEC1A]